MPIYLDNSATTPVRKEVLEAMLPYLTSNWGNPSSIHSEGRIAGSAVKKAREQVAELLNCESEEVFFSSGGTMSNNVALIGRARFAEANSLGRHLITSVIEHPAILGPAQYLQSLGWEVTFLPVDSAGKVSVNAVANAIKEETSIISIMWANNEIGTLQNIERIAALAYESGIFFHTDAVQVAGKIPLDLKQVPISALSLSGHKFYAPKGVGILFVRKGQNVMPVIFGGGQEMGLLPGTEALANIVAIGEAARLAKEELPVIVPKLKAMQKVIFEKLSALPGVCISGPKDLEQRLPGHVSFYIPGVESEAIVMRADLQGICISSGSACHKGIIEASSVMKAIGLSNHEAMGAIRITAGRSNTMEECNDAVEKLAKIFASAAAAKEKISTL